MREGNKEETGGGREGRREREKGQGGRRKGKPTV